MSIPKPRILTSQQPCPYIPGKTETLLHVVHQERERTEEASEMLSLRDALEPLWDDFGEYGFRRQGRFVYRPVCDACCECIATRVIVPEFELSRRFQKVKRINRDIEVVPSRKPLIAESEAFQLYARYIEARHAHGIMYPPDIQTMRAMLHLEPDRADMHIYGFRDDEVVFIAQTDRVRHGLSANYTIFDTDLSERSLGTFAILCQIELADQLGLKYLYLGYMLDSVKNMRYKKDFKPQQIFVDHKWIHPDEAMYLV